MKLYHGAADFPASVMQRSGVPGSATGAQPRPSEVKDQQHLRLRGNQPQELGTVFLYVLCTVSSIHMGMLQASCVH